MVPHVGAFKGVVGMTSGITYMARGTVSPAVRWACAVASHHWWHAEDMCTGWWEGGETVEIKANK